MESVVVNPDALEQLITAILRADDCSLDEAMAVAHHLVEASLCGHDSHGVIRIARYHQWLGTGQIKPCQPLRTIVDTPHLLQFDGGDGMGQWLAREAIAVGVERAREHGSCILALRRAGHIGRLGAYTEQVCRAGLISIQLCNVAGSSLVAPFGASQRCISTAPIAIGVPIPDGEDFILDFATSLVAEGKALVAGQGGAALPDTALVGADGELTSDPLALYGETLESPAPNPRAGGGALRPMGDHKGSGLALACELLAGALTGNGTNGPKEHAFGNGLLAILIDPAKLENLDGFAAEAAAYVQSVRSARPDKNTETVLTPGDKERATAAERRRDGLPLPPAVFAAITEIAEQLSIDISPNDLLRATAHGPR